MKIRSGFVSNSSTSSFLIYGVALDPSEAEKLLNKAKKAAAKAATAEAEEEDEEEDEDEEDSELYETLEEALEGTDLEMHYPDGYDAYYIGASWSGVKDDETGRQFKQRIEDQLEQVFGKKLKCGTHEEAYYN